MSLLLRLHSRASCVIGKRSTTRGGPSSSGGPLIPLPEFHAPQRIGPSLPMVLAERDQLIGSAWIAGIVPIDGAFGLRVRVGTQDRRFRPTFVHADLVDSVSGGVIDSTRARVDTNADATLDVLAVACDVDALYRDPWRYVSLQHGQAVPCVWQVWVQDDFGRSLAYRELARSYRMASRLRPAVGWPF